MNAVARHRRPPMAAASYMALVRSFPLRPLRTEKEYDAAVSIMDTLAVRPEGSLDSGEQDYLETLTLLVEARDREIADESHSHSSPLDTLKYLMDESGMTQAELARLLGNRSLASLILNGRRAMSPAVISKLAKHFQVAPSLFFKLA